MTSTSNGAVGPFPLLISNPVKLTLETDMNTMNSYLETGKTALRRCGAALAGIAGLLVGGLLVSAFATLGLAIIGIGAVAMSILLAASALAPGEDKKVATS